MLIPCYNEAATIVGVITDFQNAFPGAAIIFYDNNSTDHTNGAARNAGAAVFSETMQSKGNFVRRVFRDIEADFYIMVDGDGTYDASITPAMLRPDRNTGLIW